jgi:cellulose synthase/poly-beta-1,6-N-acetylglucosamine synthase-like glycosyltransferase
VQHRNDKDAQELGNLGTLFVFTASFEGIKSNILHFRLAEAIQMKLLVIFYVSLLMILSATMLAVVLFKHYACYFHRNTDEILSVRRRS